MHAQHERYNQLTRAANGNQPLFQNNEVFYIYNLKKAKSILNVDEISEIEQPKNLSKEEDSSGIRYYDSNSMTIRNTHEKD